MGEGLENWKGERERWDADLNGISLSDDSALDSPDHDETDHEESSPDPEIEGETNGDEENPDEEGGTGDPERKIGCHGCVYQWKIRGRENNTHTHAHA